MDPRFKRVQGLQRLEWVLVEKGSLDVHYYCCCWPCEEQLTFDVVMVHPSWTLVGIPDWDKERSVCISQDVFQFASFDLYDKFKSATSWQSYQSEKPPAKKKKKPETGTRFILWQACAEMWSCFMQSTHVPFEPRALHLSGVFSQMQRCLHTCIHKVVLYYTNIPPGRVLFPLATLEESQLLCFVIKYTWFMKIQSLAILFKMLNKLYTQLCVCITARISSPAPIINHITLTLLQDFLLSHGNGSAAGTIAGRRGHAASLTST